MASDGGDWWVRGATVCPTGGAKERKRRLEVGLVMLGYQSVLGHGEGSLGTMAEVCSLAATWAGRMLPGEYVRSWVLMLLDHNTWMLYYDLAKGH